MLAIARTRFPWEFAAVSGAVYAVALWIAAILETTDQPELIAAGITLDLTILVPGLYWLTCVRARKWPWISVVPVFALSVLLASWIIPSSYHRGLTIIEYAIAPLELAFLGFVGWRTYCGYLRYRSCRIRNADFDAVDAIRATVSEIVQVPFAARIISYEISIFYLAIFGWRISSEHDESRHFTCYRDSSYGILFTALMMVMVIELIGVHVALHIWISPTIALIVTVLSLYAALWLLGDYQALRLRPIVIECDRIRLRLGLRWEADLPFSKIRSVRPACPRAEYDLKMVVFGEPKVIVDLTEKVPAFGVYGLRRNASGILLAVDSPGRFREVVTDRLDRADL